MYAIVSTGGKQYKVAKDDIIEIEKLPAAVGDKVELTAVCLVDDGTVIVDAAALAKAVVTAEVLEQFKGEKQLVFKFKKRKGYKKLRGHRQQLTRVKVLDVAAKKPATRKTKAAVAEAPVETVDAAVEAAPAAENE